ncbi:MAG: hypothetical protein AABY75_01430 [Bacteroidota bacterium]
MSNSIHSRFAWWHRDEVQVFTLWIIISWFFTRSDILQGRLLALSALALLAPWIVRELRRWRRTDRAPAAVGKGLDALLRFLPPFAWDRSRLSCSFWSALIVGVLFAHRLELALTVPEYAAPVDVYGILFLGWYGLVWSTVTVYLVIKWRHQTRPEDHRFWEGLVGSMFFYHGLPTKNRLVTFAAGSLLGGVPTAFAVTLDPTNPSSLRTAALLILPVAGLILFGAAYASHWVGTTESGEV